MELLLLLLSLYSLLNSLYFPSWWNITLFLTGCLCALNYMSKPDHLISQYIDPSRQQYYVCSVQSQCCMQRLFQHSLVNHISLECLKILAQIWLSLALGGISSSVLSVFFTDKFALSQSNARISVAYNSCQWKTLTKRLMKCPPGQSGKHLHIVAPWCK